MSLSKKRERKLAFAAELSMNLLPFVNLRGEKRRILVNAKN